MTSYGHLLFTLQLLLRYYAVDCDVISDVVSDVIVNTRYGRVRGRRVHIDYGLGSGLICIHLHIFLCFIRQFGSFHFYVRELA